MSNFGISPGWLTIAGAFSIHLAIGTLYLWVNITSMVTSYLKQYDEDLTYNDSIAVYAIESLVVGFCMLSSKALTVKLGLKMTCAFAGLLHVLGSLGSSYCKSLPALLFCYGVLQGIGIGVGYTPPIMAAARHIPEKKGLVSGIIVSGFGVSSFVFGFISTNLANPHHEGVVDNSASKYDGYFPPDSTVLNNVPYMFRMLALCFTCLFVVGIICISEPVSIGNSPKLDSNDSKFGDIVTNPMAEDGASEEIEMSSGVRTKATVNNQNRYAKLTDTSMHASNVDEQEGGQPYNSTITSVKAAQPTKEVDYTTWEVLQLPITYHIMTCYIMSTIGGLFWIGTLKTFANKYFNDEAYLVAVFSCGSLFSCLGRITWGILSDRLGSPNALMFINCTFMVVNYLYPLMTRSKVLFAVWTFLTFFCEGGIFILFLPLTISMFGHKHSTSNYGVIFASHTVFSVTNILLMAHYDVSFFSACMAIGTLSLCATVNVFALSYHIEYFKGRSG
eukprot:gene26078-31490_t